MNRFFEELRIQRWDDHRYYHHCRINQSLHLISALSFLCAYALLLVEPAWSALLAWCLSMTTRQAGHFFFEPRGYDNVNQVTDEYKEEVKVGYNIRRKIVLMSVWAFMPVALAIDPSLAGFIEPAQGFMGYAHDVGLSWLALGVGGLVIRVLQLWQQQSLMTGIVWATKIITDPFHDVWLYHKAPMALLRGERYDPMLHVQQHR